MSTSQVLTTVIKLDDSQIVVTRKVPMTEQTCDELRMIRANREAKLSVAMCEAVSLPYPTLFAQLVHEEFIRQEEN